MRDRIQKARLRVHLGLYHNETSELCSGTCRRRITWKPGRRARLRWHHDHPATADPAAVRRPLRQPVAANADRVARHQPYEIVKGYWAGQHKGADFEAWWRKAVHDGVVPGTALPTKAPAIHGERIAARAQAPKLGGKLEAIFRPDPTIYDGRFANNGWLQELPKPITKLTWDNAAILSPATAHRLNAATGDMVQLSYQGRTLRAPVFIQPGHIDGAVTLHLGYGRTKAGRAGTGMGFNPYGLRTAQALWHDTGLEARKISGTYEFATTQNEHALDARRHIIHKGDIEDYTRIRSPYTRAPRRRRRG